VATEKVTARRFGWQNLSCLEESSMQADIRQTDSHYAVRSLYSKLWPPGKLHGASDVHIGCGDVYFTGLVASDTLESPHHSAVYRLGAAGVPEAVWPGARLARVPLNGSFAACLHSQGEGHDELRLHDLNGQAPMATWSVEGAVETLRWSPDGLQLLILVAGRSADVAGGAGGFAMRPDASGPSWLPLVSVPSSDDYWRSLWVWDPKESAPRRITPQECNPWEANWCGNDAVITVASDSHGEGAWYEAQLLKLSLDAGLEVLRKPLDQLGLPSASPDGNNIAWVEAVCSDRGLVCGTLMLMQADGECGAVDLQGIEVTDLHWRDNTRLLIVGVRGFETLVVALNMHLDALLTLWASDTHTLSGRLPQAVPFGDHGALAVVEAYAAAPVLVELAAGSETVRCRFGPETMPEVGRMTQVRWHAPDGLEIEGWLILPPESLTPPPEGWPLLLDVHGGPIGMHRARWAANLRSAPVLARQGWAVLMANPRGSSGRGQEFARQVIGDMGGADAQDLLAGVDMLVGHGIADPARLAVAGTSYGGYMSCWLVTQTQRFSAAVPISPVTNWTSQHYGSQIPWFDTAFLRASPKQPAGPYFTRSPVLHAGAATAPTLVMAGGRDKATPSGQATEFYNALVEAGVPCACAIYPEDGHSLRGMPAYLDSAARVVAWLTEKCPPAPSQS
jgi:dipeptidyl aminopeptidase/acylaminoacyl peptidase